MKVIILTGLPGSGKTTLAQSMPGYVIVNQDTLGSREACVAMLHNALKCGNNVIVDRTNINAYQRKYFLDVAKEFNVEIESLVLVTSPNTCISRIVTRLDHPTINQNVSQERKIDIVKRFEQSYEAPSLEEGFDSITFKRML